MNVHLQGQQLMISSMLRTATSTYKALGNDTVSGNSAVEQLIIDSGANDDWLIFDAEILASSLILALKRPG